MTRVFQVLPPLVFIWMMLRASLVFTPDLGRRDVRGIGFAASMWGTLAATQLGIAPPLGSKNANSLTARWPTSTPSTRRTPAAFFRT